MEARVSLVRPPENQKILSNFRHGKPLGVRRLRPGANCSEGKLLAARSADRDDQQVDHHGGGHRFLAGPHWKVEDKEGRGKTKKDKERRRRTRKRTSDSDREDSKVTLSGLLNFIDGIYSACAPKRGSSSSPSITSTNLTWHLSGPAAWTCTLSSPNINSSPSKGWPGTISEWKTIQFSSTSGGYSRRWISHRPMWLSISCPGLVEAGPSRWRSVLKRLSGT